MSEHLPPTHMNLINNTRLETAGQTALTDLRSRIRHKVEACAFLSNCPFWQHLTETLGKSRCIQGGQSQAVLPNGSGLLCSGVEADCSRLITLKCCKAGAASPSSTFGQDNSEDRVCGPESHGLISEIRSKLY